MKPSEVEHIEFIKECLRKGEGRAEILSKFAKKWQKSIRVFDRRLKLANEAISLEQERLKVLVEERVQAEAKRLSNEIMTPLERQVELTQMAGGKTKVKVPVVIDGKIMEYNREANHRERITAISELNKMDGSYSPSKVEHSGESLINILNVVTTDEQTKQAALKLKKK